MKRASVAHAINVFSRAARAARRASAGLPLAFWLAPTKRGLVTNHGACMIWVFLRVGLRIFNLRRATALEAVK